MKFNKLKDQKIDDQNLGKLVAFKYVPLIAQKTMVDNIKKICLKKEDNFLHIDYFLKNLFTLLNILGNYTDIEFIGLYNEENNFDLNLGLEIYDFFKKNGLDKIVYNHCDCTDFLDMLDNELKQELEINNSVSSILSKTLNEIANKLPSETSFKSLMSEIPTVINSVTSINKKSTKPRKPHTPKSKE